MRVNIYIRKEDEDKWNAIDNKAEWLHFHLNKGVKVITLREDGSGKIEDHYNRPETGLGLPPTVPEEKQALKKNTVLPDGKIYHWTPETKTVEQAELNAIKQYEFAEALKANEQDCCKKNTPCRHWTWQDTTSSYINTLSGRERVDE